jgi:hypothetical protein
LSAGGVQWAEVYGAFRRQLAPAAAMLLMQRYIVIIAEEKPGWLQFRPRTNYGQIITYFPINRLARFQIDRAGRFSLLELEGCRGDKGEKLVIILPRDKEEAVSRLLKSASASAERVGDDREIRENEFQRGRAPDQRDVRVPRARWDQRPISANSAAFWTVLCPKGLGARAIVPKGHEHSARRF